MILQGIVDIPLAAAAAHDPSQLALRPELGADCDRARQRRSACYAHILQVGVSFGFLKESSRHL